MAKKKLTFPEIAAVDLGSNSFRLQLARVADGHLMFHDSLRESVRLAAGLGKDNYLDETTQTRAIDCLKRFGERLRDLPPQAVRAVATNTFRVARNAPQLLKEAQAALGFPIEIIAGREEARMIFVGVSHGLPPADYKRLVVDIGGGSTELIIGQGLEPQVMESLYMGCVSYSLQFFPEGKLGESNFNRAQLAAAAEIQGLRKQFMSGRWQEAVGSSGTARALGEIIRLNNLDDVGDGAITHEGMRQLRHIMIKARDCKKLELTGLSSERAAVLPGGLSIILAIFEALDIERMATSSSALREGVLYELLGRMYHHDTREATVRSFMRRYQVDREQARRVQKLALNLLSQVDHQLSMETAVAEQYLVWAAKLHEIGISIAHSGFHKHSAYIIENADMPGFSKMEQEILGLLLRAQRRSLTKLSFPDIEDDRCLLILILRLAVMFHRSRLTGNDVALELAWEGRTFRLRIEAGWLKNNPLTETELSNEVSYWNQVGISLQLV